MWVPKLLLSPVRIRIFAQQRPNLAQNWHFLVILGQALPAHLCPVGGLVGGCGARAVSRKTPIYFILMNWWLYFLLGLLMKRLSYLLRPTKTMRHVFERCSITLATGRSAGASAAAMSSLIDSGGHPERKRAYLWTLFVPPRTLHQRSFKGGCFK